METVKSVCKKLLLLFFIAISFSSVAQNCDVDFDYTISGDTVVFQNLSPNININDNFQWNLGDGTTLLLNNILHLYNNEGIYNVCLTRTNLLAIPPCIDSVCKEVVFCVDCVWPGDANRNKISNNIDVLYVGLSYGATGAQRTIDTTTSWSPKISSVLWTDINLLELNFLSGVNYKHADCDGNGVINEDDLMPIDRNYNQTYNKRATPDCEDINDVPLYFEILYDSIEVSSPVQIAIKLGNNARPAIDAYGIAFTLNYDTHLIDSNSMSIEYVNTGFKNNVNDTIIHLNKYFKTDGQVESAVSRTNQNGKIISGETIGVINFVMEDNLAQKTQNLYEYLHLFFSDVYLIASDESRIPVCSFNDSVLIFQRTTGIEKSGLNGLKIYPNPAKTLLNIESEKEKIQAVNIYNLTGENVLSVTNPFTGIITLSLENIPVGLYFIEVQTTSGFSVRKLLKD